MALKHSIKNFPSLFPWVLVYLLLLYCFGYYKQQKIEMDSHFHAMRWWSICIGTELILYTSWIFFIGGRICMMKTIIAILLVKIMNCYSNCCCFLLHELWSVRLCNNFIVIMIIITAVCHNWIRLITSERRLQKRKHDTLYIWWIWSLFSHRNLQYP